MKRNSAVFCLSLGLLLSACQLGPRMASPGEPSARLLDLISRFVPEARSLYNLEFTPERKATGAFLVSLHVKQTDLKIQFSADGNPASAFTEIAKFRVLLYKRSSPGPLPGGPLIAGNIIGPLTLTPSLSGLQQSFLISNVDTGSYYVGIAAFNSPTVFNTTTNLLKSSAPNSYGEGLIYMTTAGGETSPNGGRVTVGNAPNFTVTGTPQLTVTVPLRDEKGAKIDSQIQLLGGRILYETNRNGDPDIYGVNPDGNNDVNLAAIGLFSQAELVLNPFDYSAFAFIDNNDGNNELYKRNINGTVPTQLTTTGGCINSAPAWSPDGNTIAYVSDCPGNVEVVSIPAGGGAVGNLSVNAANDSEPAWRHDSLKLAFVSDRDGNAEIFTMNPVAPPPPNNQTQLTFTPFGITNNKPMWSPDDTKILFTRFATGIGDIYTINANGTNLTNLTNIAGNDRNGVWSPDGSKIVFVSNRDGDDEIFVMNANGSGLVKLTNNITADTDPSWTPDGKSILYIGFDANNAEVQIMTADGRAKRQLTFTNPGIVNKNPLIAPQAP